MSRPVTAHSTVVPVRLPFSLPLPGGGRVERFVHAYLVLGEEVALVDTGAAGGERHILEAIRRLGRAPEDLRMVISSHEHADHIGGNVFLERELAPRFLCHERATRWIEDLDLQARERPVLGFHELAGRPVRIHRRLRDGERVELGGGVSLQVVFTPGHSPGHMALLCRPEGILLTADAIQPVGGLPLYLDVEASRASLRRLADLEGVRTLYRSHEEQAYTGRGIGEAIRAGLDYIDRVGEAAQAAHRELGPEAAAEELTRRALHLLGLDPAPVIPITVRSILAHLQPGGEGATRSAPIP